MFWTARIPNSGVVTNLAAGTATFQASNVVLGDYHDGGNALQSALPGGGGATPPLPGTVSFRLEWTPLNPKGKPQSTDDPLERYHMDFVDSIVRAEWKATTQGGFGFTSYRLGHYPAGKAPGNLLGVLGSERNGVFY